MVSCVSTFNCIGKVSFRLPRLPPPPHLKSGQIQKARLRWELIHAWAEKENEKHIIESIEHGDSMVGWMANYMHAYWLKCDFSFTGGREPSQQRFHKHNSKWIQSMTYVIRSNRKIKIKNEITPVCMYICMYSTYLLYRHEDWLSTCTSTKKTLPLPRIRQPG